MLNIPEMTNPMGKGWEQPKVSEIEIDETHALMSQSNLDKLMNYTWSYPSGVYAGKMWKSKSDVGPLLLWFGDEVNGECPIHRRIILVA